MEIVTLKENLFQEELGLCHWILGNIKKYASPASAYEARAYLLSRLNIHTESTKRGKKNVWGYMRNI